MLLTKESRQRLIAGIQAVWNREAQRAVAAYANGQIELAAEHMAHGALWLDAWRALDADPPQEGRALRAFHALEQAYQAELDAICNSVARPLISIFDPKPGA